MTFSYFSFFFLSFQCFSSAPCYVKQILVGLHLLWHFFFRFLEGHSAVLEKTEAAIQSILKKRCSENIQHIYRRTPMPECDFKKVAFQLYWNRASAWEIVFNKKSFCESFIKSPNQIDHHETFAGDFLVLIVN